MRSASRTLALPAVLALAALAAPNRSFAQAPTFNAFVSTPKGGESWFQPSAAAVGDFNGDGKLDALVSDGGPNLRLMLGNGDGTFTEHDVSVPGTNPGPIKAADLNGDGKLDAVLTSNGPGNTTVLINTGNDVNGVPQFTVTNYPAGGRSVTVGDLNGDGRPDFIVGNAYGGLQVYLNNGDGTFTAGQVTSLLPGAGGPSVGPGVITDLNGDGKADYVVASNQNHATNVFFGNGDGTLQAPVVIPSYGTFLAVADVNHDGKPDLIEVDTGSPDPSSGMLMVFLNSGDGKFSAPPALYPSGCAYTGSVTTADLNGDGNLDAVIGDFQGNKVAVLLGDGHGAFGAPTTYPVNLGPVDVAVRDFNGDGKPDIATVGYGDRTYGVLLNTTVFPVPTLPTPPVIFSRTTANGEGWQLYTVAFSPTQTGNYTLGFNITATDGVIVYQGSNHDDHSIYVDDVRVTSASGVSGDTFKSGFESPVVSAQQVYPNGTFGDWVFTNFSGVIPGSPSQWGPVGPEEGNQRGFVQAYNGTLSSIKTATTFHLTAGQTYTVTYWQASRSGPVGNEGVLTYTVTIDKVASDNTPPVITAPANIIAEATGPSGAVVTFTATAVDDVDGPVNVLASPPSGSTFPLGVTIVGLAATDAAHNTATASFTVTVRDTTPPVLTVPANQTLEASSAQGAVATFTATATDLVGVTSLTYSQASGSTFPLGVTTVTVTAKDAAGNKSTGAFTVTVRDTTPPVIKSLTANPATLWPPNHKMVNVTVTASVADLVDPAPLTKIISVTSNEPVKTKDDDDLAPDWLITGNLTLQLRAERLGDGPGRIYTITVQSKDASGNASTKTLTVTVPKDQRDNNDSKKDSGDDHQDSKSSSSDDKSDSGGSKGK